MLALSCGKTYARESEMYVDTVRSDRSVAFSTTESTVNTTLELFENLSLATDPIMTEYAFLAALTAYAVFIATRMTVKEAAMWIGIIEATFWANVLICDTIFRLAYGIGLRMADMTDVILWHHSGTVLGIIGSLVYKSIFEHRVIHDAAHAEGPAALPMYVHDGLFFNAGHAAAGA